MVLSKVNLVELLHIIKYETKATRKTLLKLSEKGSNPF